MIAIHTHDRFRRADKARGDREFFVAGVQQELSGQGGGNHPVVSRHGLPKARAVRQGRCLPQNRGAGRGGRLT